MSRTSSLRKPGSFIHKFALVVLCATLAFSLVPVSSPAYGADTSSSTYGAGTNDEHWSDYIDEMLEAGDYVEGSVLVAVDSSLAADSSTMLLSMTLLSTSSRSTDLLASTGLLTSTNLLASAEALMDVSAEAYAIATSESLETHEADSSNSGIATLSLSTLEPDEAITISYIESEELSTKEILENLANDPRVLLAQPNYIREISDDTALDDAVAEVINEILDDSVDDENATDSESEAQENETQTSSTTDNLDDDTGASFFEPADAVYVEEDIMDLTDYQWGFDNNASTMVSPNSEEGFDIAPTYWDDSTQTNSSGLVAILDTGVDYTHPDLASVMHDMTQYGDIGGGQYGFNATDSESADDPMDANVHGTHVAGIVAAAWNEEGTSGAANGVELVAVRAGDEEGYFLDSCILSGFAYISRAIDAGADIRITNCSWGGYDITYVINLAIAELGQKGAITVFAAGNNAADLDTTQATASSLYSNPYVVVVSASTQDGTPANFTDYGQLTSDVYAPGASILSTVPSSDASYLAFADSEAMIFETFDDNTAVNEQSSETADEADATGITISADEDGSTLVGELSDGSYRFDQSGTSWKVSTDDLEEFSEGFSSIYIQVLVEDDDLDQVAGLSLAFGSDFLDPTYWTITAYLYVRVVDSSGEKYWAQASVSGFRTSWVHLSANLADILTDNDAEGIYLNEDGCIELMIYFGDTSGDPGSGNVYLDVIGVGKNFVPYAFYDGTSMAAPAAAGAAAILSDSDEITSISDPAERASALATLLRASTIYYDSLAGTVSSNGQVSLEAETVQGMTPVVASASIGTAESAGESQTAIIIEGSYFGNSAGNVSVGGYDAEILSWSNSEIVVACPSELITGTHLIEVTASGGGKGTAGATLEIPDTISEIGIFSDIEIPEELFGQNLFEGIGFLTYMHALSGYLYFAPVSINNDNYPYQKLFRYSIDSKTWEWVDDFPESLELLSMTNYEGRLLVLGSVEEGERAGTMILLSLDPDTGQWTELDASNIPYGASIANYEGQLMLFGSMWVDPETEEYGIDTENNIMEFDIETGEVTAVGSLAIPSIFSLVSVGEGEIYVWSGTRVDEEGDYIWDYDSINRLVYSDGSWVATDVTDLVPAQADGYDTQMSVVALADGFAVIGYEHADSDGNADGYNVILIDPDTGEVSTYDSRTSVGFFVSVGAFGYEGILYTLGYAPFDGDWVLRYTEIATAAVAGEEAPDDDGEDDDSGSTEGSDEGSGEGSDSESESESASEGEGTEADDGTVSGSTKEDTDDGEDSESDTSLASDSSAADESSLPKTFDSAVDWRLILVLIVASGAVATVAGMRIRRSHRFPPPRR